MQIIKYQSDKLYILPKDSERRELEKFPGLFKDGPYFYFPNESRIVYNIVNRLKRKFKTVELDKFAESTYLADFKLKEIPENFSFFTQPKDFQKIALRFVYTAKGGGLLLEPGMGKTKIVLDFIALMGFKKSLIICPKPLCFVWEDEKQIHRPDKSIFIVKSTNWEGELPGILASDITVINYSKAVIFCEKLLIPKFDFIGIDEALIKDPVSQRTKVITWLGRRIENRMLMSGTLVNNSPLDVFSPIRFLEPVLVGTSFTKFSDEYAKKINIGGNKIVVGYKKVEEVKAILDSVSIVMTKNEWLKLPAKKFTDIHVQISDKQREIYQELQSNYIAAIGDQYVEIQNPLSALTKLIQVSNGFVYFTNDNSLDDLAGDNSLASVQKKKIKRETFYFSEQPKLDALIKILKFDRPDRRCIVWFNMDGEYELISKRFEEENIQFRSIRGGEKDVGAKIRLFNSKPVYRVLLCQSKSVNYGVTVLGVDYEDSELEAYPGITPEVFTEIFYSMNFSLEVYLQQQDRIHRLGQEFECEYIRIIANTEAERRIIDKIDEKLSIRGQILVDIINSLGLEKV